jgi:hypothetical protein
MKTGVDQSTIGYFMHTMIEDHVLPVLKEELDNNPTGPCGVLLMS